MTTDPKLSPFRTAIAELDRRLDAGDTPTEDEVWALLAFRRDDNVRLEISRLLHRVRATQPLR
jgi:hypothetical protein